MTRATPRAPEAGWITARPILAPSKAAAYNGSSLTAVDTLQEKQENRSRPMNAKYFLAFSLLLISVQSFASANDFELHRLKAQKYIETKDWKSAEGEAKGMTEADSANLDGWLM